MSKKGAVTAKNTVISPNFLHSLCGVSDDCQKLCGNCEFPQNFRTRKLDEITIFCAVCGMLMLILNGYLPNRSFLFNLDTIVQGTEK